MNKFESKDEVLVALALVLVLFEEQDKAPWGDTDTWERLYTVYRDFEAEVYFACRTTEFEFPMDMGAIELARALAWFSET